MISRLFIFIVIIGLLSASCKRQVTGTGEIITDERSVTDFQAIEMRGAGNLKITYGTDQKIIIEGYENLVPLVETDVKNGKLMVTMEMK